MFRVFGGGVLAALVGAVAVQAAPSVVTNPDWLVRPDGRTIAETYPHTAWVLGLEGRAVISCAVDTAGLARNCLVVEQHPPGLGFGAATLEASKSFRFSPKRIDGRPVSGTVRVPLRYVHPDISDAVSPPPKLETSLPPATVTRLGAAISARIIAFHSGDPTDLLGKLQPDVVKETRASALSAKIAAARKIAPLWGEAAAAVYASVATEAQMDAATAFEASSEAHAMAAKDGPISRKFEAINAESFRNLSSAARAGYCARSRCDARPPGPHSEPGSIQPTWRRQPHWRDLDDARPPLSTAFGVGGWARLTCLVTNEGSLSFCISAEESPQGFGFGDAAIAVSEAYQVSQGSMDLGAQGETVSVVVEFPSPWVDPNPAKMAPAIAASAARLAVARQIVAVGQQAEKAARGVTALEVELNRISGLTDDDRGAAADALRQAIIQALPGMVERQALAYAESYAEPELKALLSARVTHSAILARPGGSGFDVAMAKVDDHYGKELRDEARRIFCAERACDVPSPAAP